MHLSNFFAREGHDVLVLMLRGRGELAEELMPGVLAEQSPSVRHLHWFRARLAVWRPDAVISRLLSAHLATHLALWRSPLAERHVAYEDLDPAHHFNQIRHGKLKRAVAGAVYRKIPKLLATTSENAKSMKRVYGLSGVPEVIHPCINLNRSSCTMDTEAPRVLSVGSLTPRKNWWLALDVMQRLPGLEWLLVGDGPQREVLMEAASSRKLSVRHIRHAPDATTLMRPGDVLLHTSNTESFSLVIGEAISRGTKVVSTSTTGSRYWKSLFPSMVSISGEASEMADNIRSAVGQSASMPDLSDWSVEEVGAQWLKYLEMFMSIP